MVSNLSVLEGIFETKFQGLFFFAEKFLRDFFCKIHPVAEKRRNFQRISFVKLKTIINRDFSCKIEGEFNFLGMIFGKKLQEIST